MTRNEAADRYFLEMRCRALDLAAALDRLDRAAPGEGADATQDPRLSQLREAIAILAEEGPGRAERIQLAFSREYDAEWMEKRARS